MLTRSNELSAKGIAVASAHTSSHSIGRRGTRASISAELSSPVARRGGRSDSEASLSIAPVPVATSSSRVCPLRSSIDASTPSASRSSGSWRSYRRASRDQVVTDRMIAPPTSLLV